MRRAKLIRRCLNRRFALFNLHTVIHGETIVTVDLSGWPTNGYGNGL